MHEISLSNALGFWSNADVILHRRARDAAVSATGTDRQEDLQPRFEGLPSDEPALQVHERISSICQSCLLLSGALWVELLTGRCRVACPELTRNEQ